MEKSYIALRNAYLPKELKAIFVLESPPLGHGYFYDPSGRVSEVLFRLFMKAVLDFTPVTKDEGLKKLAASGYVLVNPIYTPVNKMKDADADALILANYDAFKKDLTDLMKGKNIPIILIKSNICRLLEKPLIDDGFTVLNKGVMIPFPLHYHFETFAQKIRACLAIQ
jgi:hypothetical protein